MRKGELLDQVVPNTAIEVLFIVVLFLVRIMLPEMCICLSSGFCLQLNLYIVLQNHFYLWIFLSSSYIY